MNEYFVINRETREIINWFDADSLDDAVEKYNSQFVPEARDGSLGLYLNIKKSLIDLMSDSQGG